jgi:hypothetical protein
VLDASLRAAEIFMKDMTDMPDANLQFTIDPIIGTLQSRAWNYLRRDASNDGSGQNEITRVSNA